MQVTCDQNYRHFPGIRFRLKFHFESDVKSVSFIAVRPLQIRLEFSVGHGDYLVYRDYSELGGCMHMYRGNYHLLSHPAAFPRETSVTCSLVIFGRVLLLKFLHSNSK